MNAQRFQVSANLVDIPGRRIYPATVAIERGKIASIAKLQHAQATFVLPGFIDAHVHIESSMLVPSQFARAAVVHGTVATVSDPHEIANVLGVDGVRFMLNDAQRVPFKFFFGAPSCVPATTFETAGGNISPEQVAELLDDPRIVYLSEMMNYPGVLARDSLVMAKIKAAGDRNKPVDGHAPGLRGLDAKNYFAAGISTDHECFTKQEALDKIACGAKILIREGSAARDFDQLYTIIDEYPDRCMFSSDDKHPDDLLEGHINQLVRRAARQGMDMMNVLRCACVNPVEHYGLGVGLLREGDPADFIEVDNLEDLGILRTFIDGRLVAYRGARLIGAGVSPIVNRFRTSKTTVGEFRVEAVSSRVHVMEALDGQLITRHTVVEPKIVDGAAVADPERDILKITVVNRYNDAPPAVAFVRNFGLKSGAIASSVAHDSHNVIAVGASDEHLCAAVNLVIEARGGLAVASNDETEVLPLPVAGLMSTDTCNRVAARYVVLDHLAKQLGSQLRAPFMTLSFMALLVIPEYKLSDKGLFDGGRFQFVPLFLAE
jgi:adenine deaminase